MKTRMIAMTALCAVLFLALAHPVLADNPAQADIQQTAAVTQAGPADSDPVGSLMGFLGLRHEIRDLKAENRNLTQDLGTNQQEIQKNWWENIGFFNNILGNRETVRSGQQENLADRQANLGLREDIRNARLDMKNDTGNRSAYLGQIAGDKATIRGNLQEINATHAALHDERNLSKTNWSALHENNQEDLTLRQENNATRGEIRANHVQIQEDRQQIRDGKKNGSPAGSP